MPERNLAEEARTRLRRIEGQVRGIQGMLDSLDGGATAERTRELLAEGMTHAQVATELGISRMSLYKKLHKYGSIGGRPGA